MKKNNLNTIEAMLTEDEYTPEDAAKFQSWLDIQDDTVILLPIEELVVEYSSNKFL